MEKQLPISWQNIIRKQLAVTNCWCKARTIADDFCCYLFRSKRLRTVREMFSVFTSVSPFLFLLFIFFSLSLFHSPDDCNQLHATIKACKQVAAATSCHHNLLIVGCPQTCSWRTGHVITSHVNVTTSQNLAWARHAQVCSAFPLPPDHHPWHFRNQRFQWVIW